MFKVVSKKAFANYHNEFQGDTWEICIKCGGMCEINKVGSLIPGELEYITETLNQNPDEFRDKYLDGIKTPYGIIDVLKIKPGCPFLDSAYRCTIKDVKPVLCDVYPIVFEVKNEKVNFFLDDWCPIVRTVPVVAKKFAERGIAALEKLKVDIDWFKAVELYDYLCVDYFKLFRMRKNSFDYSLFCIEDLKECQVQENGSPTIELNK